MVTRSDCPDVITVFMLTKAFRISRSGKKMINLSASPSSASLYMCLNGFQFQPVSANFSTAHLSFFFDTSQPQGTFPFLLLRPSIHPSTHLKPNWRPVSDCNLYHDHTFVFVPVIKHRSSPWSPCRSVVVVKNVFWLSVDIWRSERDKNLCVCVEWESLHPLYLGHIHLSGWLASLSVLSENHTHTHTFVSARMSICPPPSLLTPD